EELLDVVGRLEVGIPGAQAGLECVGVLAGEDGGLGAHAVLEGVHFRTLLALGCFRAAGPLLAGGSHRFGWRGGGRGDGHRRYLLRGRRPRVVGGDDGGETSCFSLTPTRSVGSASGR